MSTFRLSWLAALLLGAILACSPALPAAEGGAPGAKHGRGGGAVQERINQMLEQFGLSAEQKTRFLALQREHYQKMNSPGGQSDLTPEQRTEQFRQMRAAFEKKLKDSKILTDEQFAQWKEFQGQPRAGAAGGQSRPDPLPKAFADSDKPVANTTSAEALAVFQKLKKSVCAKLDFPDPYVEVGSAATARAMYLEMIRSAGFTGIRCFFNSSRAAQSYEEAVKDALQKGLAVNLCMFAWPGISQEQYVAKWSEFALFFKDYPPDLVFEMMNEPMLAPKLSDNRLVMEWINAAVGAIREISPTRILLIGGPQFMQAPFLKQVNPDTIKFKLPDGTGFNEDKNLFGAFHMYEPGKYTMPKGQSNTLADIPNWKSIVITAFDQVEDWSKQWGKPVVMTEWAAQNNLKVHSDFLTYTRFVAEEASKRNLASMYYCGVPDNRMVWSILNTEKGWDQGVLDILTGVTAPMIPPLNQIIDPEFARKESWAFSDPSRLTNAWVDGKKVLLAKLTDAQTPVSIWQDGSIASEKKNNQGGPAAGHVSGPPLFLRENSTYTIRFRASARRAGASITAKLEQPATGKTFHVSNPQNLDATPEDYAVTYQHQGPMLANVRLTFQLQGANNEILLERASLIRAK